MNNVSDGLREVAEAGDEALIKTLLLETQCNPKDANPSGETALIHAAAGGHASCVELLLSGSDALSKDRWGRTALLCAASGGNKLCVQLLLPVSNALVKARDGYTSLMGAASRGQDSCVQLLLPVSDALATNENGYTALMCAVAKGQDSCVQYLLPVSDVFAKNKAGQTASSMANSNGYTELGQLIDAYALAISELATLQSFALPANATSPVHFVYDVRSVITGLTHKSRIDNDQDAKVQA